jgi:hypothetical protein
MTRFFEPQKPFYRHRNRQIDAATLTGLSQQCGMTNAGEALVVNPGGANGRQEQRSGRDVAKHDRRDGEGIQFLRQSGDGFSMNLPSRAQMVSMAERLQSIEGQLNEIKALLHQVHNNSGAPQGGYMAAPKPPRTKRPPAAGGEQK